MEGRFADARRDLREAYERAVALSNPRLAAAVEQELALLDAREEPGADTPPEREPSFIYN